MCYTEFNDLSFADGHISVMNTETRASTHILVQNNVLQYSGFTFYTRVKSQGSSIAEIRIPSECLELPRVTYYIVMCPLVISANSRDIIQ